MEKSAKYVVIGCICIGILVVLFIKGHTFGL